MKETDGSWNYSHIIALLCETDVFVDDAIVIYPNPLPVDHTLFVSLPAQGEYALTIYDVTGKRVYHRQENIITNRITRAYNLMLSPGTYMIDIQGEKTYETYKLIVVQ